MNNWIGCSVSVHCGDTLGTYQGQIYEVTEKTITLTKAFRNGFPYPRPEVTLKACDIQKLELIEIEPCMNTKNQAQSTITVAKPVAKRLGRSVSVSEAQLMSKNINFTPKNKTCDVEQSKAFSNSLSECTPFKSSTPNFKKEKTRMKKRDEECFGTPLDVSLLKDFDFEKNLALFDKQAMWDELNSSQKPDVIRQADKRPVKYRHDENVIATLPTVFREIDVPLPDMKEYVTDAGLVVPSITAELRTRLWAAAENCGLSWSRRAELMGRAATEMSLQLLGGGHRLNPYNTHQAPTVVALCGPHNQGAVGIITARQLASHGVITYVYLTGSDVSENVKNELNIYKLTKNKYTTRLHDLPSIVDLIIVALCEDSENPTSYSMVAEWTNQNRAPVLALDPPAIGTPGVITKYSLVPVLPLSHSVENGKLYLSNLGIPSKVFTDIGIKYRAPFGPKFVIPLYPNDT